MKRHAGLGLLLVPALPLACWAQEYRWDRVDELAIRFRILNKLERVPLKFDDSEPCLRARYQPASEGDYIWGSRGKFVWYLWVYEFPGSGGAHRPPAAPAAADAPAPTTFREFVTSGFDGRAEQRRFVISGEPRGRNPAAAWWEYTDTMTGADATGVFQQIWYTCAAVYELDSREVALVISMPSKRGELDNKHRTWATTMLLSVRPVTAQVPSPTPDQDRYAFADTAERRAAVAAAEANIKDLGNWDMLTTKSYIVLYSWPPKSPEKRRKHESSAREIAADMERMRELYEQHYPPPASAVFPYSILRICSTATEFQRYSDTTESNLLGWFSPKSKELVLFLDNDEEQTKTVAYHEGWHQYSDTYFGDVELHRWFDEGTGDFFGSFRPIDGKWRYDVSRMRKVNIKTIVSTNQFVPLREIVAWGKNRFYDANAGSYYAQGYALVDFLMRGRDEHAAGWDESWSSILPTYRDKVLATKDPALAVEAAFAGIDWDRFTRAWISWVKDY
jgi:hypothetical protein